MGYGIDQDSGNNRKKLIEIMQSKKRPEKKQRVLFEQDLEHLLDQRHELYKLANRLNWAQFEAAFSKYYSHTGRPAKAVRQMVGLLLVKQLKNLSDDQVCALWSESPYVQYFCGETHFQWGQPCAPSDLTHFRNRIGDQGVELIFKATVELHREKVEKETELVVDTTVQEANVTYPTDTKLRRRMIEHLWKMGEEAAVAWDHSYKFTVPKVLSVLKTRSNSMQRARRKAEKKLKTLAGRLLREFERKASGGWLAIYRERLEVFRQVLRQGPHDAGASKIYSLHDPSVLCIGKGKAHKKWEFGRKASVAMTRDSGVIVSAVSFETNLYDGDTLDLALIHAKDAGGDHFETALVDRGYRGRSEVSGIAILPPHKRKKTGSYYSQQKERKRFARRSAIEPVIGHLKNDFRMARCFLKGARGASQNLMLAAAAWNLKKWINESSFYTFLLNLWQWLLNHECRMVNSGWKIKIA